MHNLQEFIKRKWPIVLAVFISVTILLAFIFQTGTKQVPFTSKEENALVPIATSAVQEDVRKKELQKAIATQKQVDQQYSDWQIHTRETYPWAIHLPIYSERFYTYFDFTAKTFVGRLYPKSGDLLENLKSEVKSQLSAKGIPINDYTFDWKVFPQ